MNRVKKKKLSSLAKGLGSFEDSRDAVKNSDFTDLKTFIKDYLNTSESKQRKKLADEFCKRHLELYTFLKENPELVAAETDITAILKGAASGEQTKAVGDPFADLTTEELRKIAEKL